MKHFFSIIILIVLFSYNIEYIEAEETYLKASWYSIESLKKEGTYKTSQGIMANGRRFTDEGITCASWDYKLGTMLRIRNNANGKSIIVQVTDRTARRFKGKRIDLSRKAFEVLASLSQGLISVKIESL